MIQIELPCCDATVDLPADASSVRCEACAVEHLLAADARLSRSANGPEPGTSALAA